MNDLEKNTSQLDYEIIVQGLLDERWMRWFDGMQRRELPGERTQLRGRPADQPALYGMLSRIRDLGFPLLLVRRGDVVLDFDEINSSRAQPGNPTESD